jgi:hypothetical protein
MVMALDRSSRLRINPGDTLLAGYQLAVRGSEHPDATVALVSGSVQADVFCHDGRSYTLTVPFPTGLSYSIAAGDEAFVPNRLTLQGTAIATGCGGVVQGAYYTALGISPGTGNPGGPGFTTTTPEHPLLTKFQIGVGRSVAGSAPVIVNFGP